MDELRVAVLGVGRIGTMHADVVAHDVPGATLVGVADAVPEIAETVAAKLGVPAVDLDKVLERDDVDAVAICSSTDTHADLMISAAQAGKAILCEKPISLDLPEVDHALAEVDAAGVPLMIGFNRRFDPAHLSVRDAVATGSVGEPHLVRISSRDPAPPPLDYVRVSGGMFLDMTIHDFDMARFVTGSDVAKVYADAGVRIVPGFSEVGDVDTAVVTLRHENGCLTVIDNSRQAVYGFDQRVEVFGAKGMAASENPAAHTGILRTSDGTHASPLPNFFLERYSLSYQREWAAFVDAVRRRTPPPVTGADGRAPLLIGLAARRSLREHRPVRVAEIEAA
ncbi:MAG TPA: inositol 2-dehydrogenase [Acidimicrobiales bacterium]|nr:inositol 2-dehydrogenase [Acidimicrobiales bacterium]